MFHLCDRDKIGMKKTEKRKERNLGSKETVEKKEERKKKKTKIKAKKKKQKKIKEKITQQKATNVLISFPKNEQREGKKYRSK